MIDSLDRGRGFVGPVTMHPDAAIPDEAVHASYVTLLSALARHEPDALERIGRILEDEASERSGERTAGSAVKLVRSWLAFTGHVESVEASPSERRFSFAYPATMTFDLVGTGTARSARSRALRALRAIEGDDVPLCGFSGAHPTHPALLNVTVWVGSIEDRSRDRLRLELAGDDDAEG
ncbi:MAG TPA: hypothetical protein VFS20_25915 [Longimicrobium sp.]|nr:hypothetical protein [Longimicrobium sp.]